MAEKKGRSVEYKGNFYLFADDIPSALLCSICLGLCCDPHQAVCCGKVFCLQCVESARLKKPKEGCPCCRQPIQTFPDKRTEQEIGSLRIACGNVDRGCQEQLELRDARKHKEICPLELIPCLFADVGCSETMLRRDMEEHDRKEIIKHLHFCRKRIAAMGGTSHSREALTKTNNVKNVDQLQKVETTVPPHPTRVFNLEVHDHHRMFGQSFTWTTDAFKLQEWSFSLSIKFSPSNMYSNVELFVCIFEQGQLTRLDKGLIVHMYGEWKIILKESGKIVHHSDPFHIKLACNGNSPHDYTSQPGASVGGTSYWGASNVPPNLKVASCVIYQLRIWRLVTSKRHVMAAR